MKKYILVTIFQLFCIFVFCQDSTEGSAITLHFEGMKSDKGDVFVALFDEEAKFLSTASFMQGRTNVKELQASFVFENVPPGTYGISAFHDENENELMDTKIFGIPKERTGCSMGAVGKFGPPKWKDAKFEVTEEDLEMTIELAKY